MNEMKLQTKDLRLGVLRELDLENKGVCLEEYGHVFLVDGSEEYYNPFCVSDDYLICKRFPISNTTKDGESYGTKLKHVQGDICSGPCIVLEDKNLEDFFGEVVGTDDLIKYILHSRCFFKDYENVVKSMNFGRIVEKKLLNKRLDEIKKLNEFLGENKVNQLKK